MHAWLGGRGGAALLHMTRPAGLPEVMELFAGTWRLKSEFHVTLVGSSAVRGLPKANLEGIVRNAARGIEFDVALRDEYWRVVEGDTRTLIQMCDVAGEAGFFSRLDEALGVPVARPPFHVTLYTMKNARGISVATETDLERLGTRVTGDDHEELMRAFRGVSRG